MNKIRGKYRSRKTMKRALHLKQSGHESRAVNGPTGIPFLGSIVDRLKSAFGSSKHRKARVQRFRSRHRG